MNTSSLETKARKKKWTLILLHGARPSLCGGPGMQGTGQEHKSCKLEKVWWIVFLLIFTSFHSLPVDNIFPEEQILWPKQFETQCAICSNVPSFLLTFHEVNILKINNDKILISLASLWSLDSFYDSVGPGFLTNAIVPSISKSLLKFNRLRYTFISKVIFSAHQINCVCPRT